MPWMGQTGYLVLAKFGKTNGPFGAWKNQKIGRIPMAKAVAKINIARVLIGGAVSGIILFAFAALVNGNIYKSQWMDWQQSMGNRIHPPVMEVSMVLWLILNLLLGFLGVILYASIRPRYGAGPKTALLTGLLLWLASQAPALLDRKALGILPESIVNGQFGSTLIAMLIAVFVGAWIYKE
jgi:hypothetical protein